MSRTIRGAFLITCLAMLAPMASQAQISFIPGTPRKVPNGPSFIAAGDFNGDNIDDAVVASTVRDRVTVLYGSPFGDYQSIMEIPVGLLLRGLTVADLNGDRLNDILVTDVYQSRLFVINGGGSGGKNNGTFSTPTGFLADRRGPVDVATGNLDGNTQKGIDAATVNGQRNTFTVFRNDGGNRGLISVGNFPTGLNPRSIVIMDVNGDRVDDILTLDTGTRGTDEVSVFLNTGTGSFQGVVPQRYVVGVQAKAMTVGDFNNDGRKDLAVLNASATGQNTFSISILLAQANPAFQVLPPAEFTCPARLNGIPVVCIPQDIRAADFDGDTRVDLAVSFSTRATDTNQVTAGFVNVYSGLGSGRFEFATQNIVGLGPRQISVADLTGDAVPDITVTEFTANTVRTLIGKKAPLRGNGYGCTVGNQCESGNCVDGVCCSTINCPPGQRCDVYPPNYTSPDGVCREPAPNGDRCSLDNQCQSGHCVDGFCCSSRSCPPGNYCNSGDCGPPAPNGIGCTENVQCASGFCTDGVCCSDERCAVNAACNIPGFEGQCFTRLQIGSPCTDNSQCCTDMTDPTKCDPSFCVDGFCCESACSSDMTCALPGREGLCLPRPTPTATPLATPTPAPLGEPCDRDSQCLSGYCTDGVCCNARFCTVGSCSVPGKAGNCAVSPIGGPCDDSADCVAGAVCAPGFPNGTCQLPTPTPTATPGKGGDPCGSSAECQAGLVCNYMEGVCCKEAECPSGYSCKVFGHQGQCYPVPTPLPGNGALCGSGSQCESGNCVDRRCCELPECPLGQRCDIYGVEGYCADPGEAGDPCRAHSDCVSGLMCYGSPLVCNPPPSPTATFDVPPLFTPTPPVIVSTHRSGGCAIDTQNSNGLLLLSLLPVALWLRRRSAVQSAGNVRD